jgi:hypothetical protein
MPRAGRLLLFAAMIAPASAGFAQEAVQTSNKPPSALDRYRDLTSVAPRRSNCAAGRDTREILVCGRRQENLRYRLPLPVYDPERMSEANVRTERFALTAHRMEGGSGSCSAVGPNGPMGCFFMVMREIEEAGDEPGLIARALTYLDPDE